MASQLEREAPNLYTSSTKPGRMCTPGGRCFAKKPNVCRWMPMVLPSITVERRGAWKCILPLG